MLAVWLISIIFCLNTQFDCKVNEENIIVTYALSVFCYYSLFFSIIFSFVDFKEHTFRSGREKVLFALHTGKKRRAVNLHHFHHTNSIIGQMKDLMIWRKIDFLLLLFHPFIPDRSSVKEVSTMNMKKVLKVSKKWDSVWGIYKKVFK